MHLPADKPYYRIGEIASWLDVETHVIRFWEEEFSEFLCPHERSQRGQRVYSRRQAVVFGTIKELLYTELYTIIGARRQLRLARERMREDEERRAG